MTTTTTDTRRIALDFYNAIRPPADVTAWESARHACRILESYAGHGDELDELASLLARAYCKADAERLAPEETADRRNRCMLTLPEAVDALEGMQSGEARPDLKEGDTVRISRDGNQYSYVPFRPITGETCAQLIERRGARRKRQKQNPT